MGRSRISELVALVAITVAYIAVRFWNLTATCLWFDEIFSIHAAEHSWNSILNFIALDLIHPPLFYLVLKVWLSIGGDSVFWVRLLPLLFSVGAVVPFLLLCRELRLGRGTTVLAYFLIAVNGPLIKYAQEVRMYSMLMCLSLVSIWIFAKYLRLGSGIIWLTAINLILVYTHYYGWLVVAGEIVVVIWLKRSKWKQVVFSVGATALGFLPWAIGVVIAARSGSDLGQNIGWMTRPGPISVGQLILGLVEPFYFAVTSIDPASYYPVSIPLALLAISAIVLRFSSEGVGGSPNKLLLTMVVIPIIAALTISWIMPYSIWGTRHLIIIFAPFAIILAVALIGSKQLVIRIGGTVSVLLFSTFALFSHLQKPMPRLDWCGYEELGHDIITDSPWEPIVVFEDLAAYHLWFTFRNAQPGARHRVIKVEDVAGMTEDTAYFLPRGFNDEFVGRQPALPQLQRFWTVYRFGIFDPLQPPLALLSERGYKVVRHEEYVGDIQRVIAVQVQK